MTTNSFVLEIEWYTDKPMPRLVGPFESRAEAEQWGLLNIPNGSWSVSPLAYPYLRHVGLKSAPAGTGS